MTLSANDLIGHSVAGYRLARVLGVGGAGAVFLAQRDDDPAQQVAIKILMPPTMDAEQLQEFRVRFLREARMLSQILQHPHILPVLDSGEDDAEGVTYMIMPYMSGGTLADRIAQGPVPLADVARYVAQIAAALDYAHSQQVAHRDIKPANVLLDPAGQVYLADFGIAKLFDTAATTLTDMGRAIGTPEYMSPEQAQGDPVTNATDIYGLGMLTYHLVTGRLPFPVATVARMLVQVITLPPAPPREFRADLPTPAAAVILRALAKNPAERFISAEAFAQAFALGITDQWAPELLDNPTVQGFVTPPTMISPPTAPPTIQTFATPPTMVPPAYPQRPAPPVIWPDQPTAASPTSRDSKRRNNTPVLLLALLLLLLTSGLAVIVGITLINNHPGIGAHPTAMITATLTATVTATANPPTSTPPPPTATVVTDANITFDRAALATNAQCNDNFSASFFLINTGGRTAYFVFTQKYWTVTPASGNVLAGERQLINIQGPAINDGIYVAYGNDIGNDSAKTAILTMTCSSSVTPTATPTKTPTVSPTATP